MTTEETPTHVPGADWSREKLQAFLDYYGTTPAAADAAGVTRQRFGQVMARFGLAAPEVPTVDPAAQPMNAGRKNPLVTVALRPEHHAWIAAQGPKMRSAMVQRGLYYLSAPDRAAWLAQNEDADTLSRAAAMAQSRA